MIIDMDRVRYAMELYPTFSSLPDTVQTMLYQRTGEDGLYHDDVPERYDNGSLELNDEELDTLKLIRRNGE